jgi:hypothetical protein
VRLRLRRRTDGSAGVSDTPVRGQPTIRWRFTAPLLAMMVGPPAALVLDGDPRAAIIAAVINVAAAIFGYKAFVQHSFRDLG